VKSHLTKTWIRHFQKGLHYRIPLENFAALTQQRSTLFNSLIQGKPIDLYVYNADTGDLVFGRASLQGRYPRELAHHIGLVRRYIKLSGRPAEEKFSQGSLDVAVGHDKKEIYFKHLTLGLQDMIFPEELEWVTHIASLQDLAMQTLREIGMPETYKKIVVKAPEWARIRTGLMRGNEISYEQWKKQLLGGRIGGRK